MFISRASAWSLAAVLIVCARADAQIKPQIDPWTVPDPACDAYFLLTPGQAGQDAVSRRIKLQNLAAGETPETTKNLAQCLISLSAAIDEAEAAAAGRVATAATSANIERLRLVPNARVMPQNEPATTPTESRATTSSTATSDQEAHTALKRIYLSFRNAERWVDAFKAQLRPGESAPDGDEEARIQFLTLLTKAHDELAAHLHAKLSSHGLTQPFAATLITAFALNSAGSTTESGDGDTTGDTTTNADAAGFVAFESMHFYSAPGRKFDVAVSGIVGFRPTLALVAPASAGGDDDAIPNAIAQYQQAFAWGVWAEPNLRLADLAELTPFMGFGQTILTSSTSLIENGVNSQVGLVATSGAEKGATFAEFGAKLSIYAQSLEILHLNKGMLSPMFGMALGIRRDNRFQRAGILKDTTSPEQRLFVRLSTDAIPLQDPAREDKTFTLNVAIEYEKPLRSVGTIVVPSGTRVLIRGDLNLFKAVRGDQ